ncbi:uncharacterized protein LOC105664368 [Megachile rotundata]|uniref:uncharacterized protein LOC105664368 n=1 Tax=Megachile rotundata TaxID=143995 RepID=UPI003FCFDFD7
MPHNLLCWGYNLKPKIPSQVLWNIIMIVEDGIVEQYRDKRAKVSRKKMKRMYNVRRINRGVRPITVTVEEFGLGPLFQPSVYGHEDQKKKIEQKC